MTRGSRTPAERERTDPWRPSEAVALRELSRRGDLAISDRTWQSYSSTRGIVPDPDGIITAGHGNKADRTMAIRQDETINTPALTAMFLQIIADNRAGGWRKFKRTP